MTEPTNYKLHITVENPEAMPEDLQVALQAIAQRVAMEQDGAGDDVTGFAMNKLEIGLGRGGPVIKAEPASWCVGYTEDEFGEDGKHGSCWINWY